jgi:hypothetical protein
MGKKFSANGQHELFDDSTRRWSKLPGERRESVEELLVQLLISAIQEHSVIHKEEDDDAS